MKKLVTSKGEFVNYSSITKELDHWLCDGIIMPFVIVGDTGTIEDYVHVDNPIIEVPRTITPRQARLALLNIGLLDDIEAMVANDRAMQIWWEYSLEINRDNEHILSAQTALNLTDEQLDNLFIEGSKL